MEQPQSHINWKDGGAFITPHFQVKDALFLHSWNRLAEEEKDGVELGKIVTLCNKLEAIRELLGCPINVHSMFRSVLYNRDQNINPVNDVHSQSVACDFDCSPHLTINEIKERLRSQLATLNIRMERGTKTWVHIDLKMPGPSGREFVA